jgi:general secretion pathway protein G
MHKKLSMFLIVNKRKGFTIVELLVVIVVIGILASIVIVAYNGVQTRAKNAKTVSAVNAWIEALNLYKVDNGKFPHIKTCLGSLTTYSGGSSECFPGYTVQPTFLTTMGSYISSPPEPDTSVADPANYPNHRGAFFYGTDASGADFIYVFFINTGTCPRLPSTIYAGVNTSYVGGIRCLYRVDL